MLKLKLALECVVLAALAFLLVALGIHGSVTLDSADAVLRQASTTLYNVNRPCKGPAGPQACGTLAEINKLAVDIGDTTVTTQRQVALTATLVGQYGVVLQGIGGDIHATTLSASQAMQELSQTAHAATGVIQTTGSLVRAEQPQLEAILGHADGVLSASDKTIQSFNLLVSDPAIPRLLTNSADITATTSHMLVTADAVETKATHNYLHPSTNPFARTWQAVNPFLIPAATVAARVVP